MMHQVTKHVGVQTSYTEQRELASFFLQGYQASEALIRSLVEDCSSQLLDGWRFENARQMKTTAEAPLDLSKQLHS
jgi:hypothetical protein